jgi:Uma2 family endonuclease
VRPGLKRKLDYSDLQLTPDDGRRYELERGDLLVTPSPSLRHQRACRELFVQLMSYFHGRRLAEVFFAPTDLILTAHDVFVPDLVVTTDPASPSGRGIEKPPLLVVEVLSPSTCGIDRGLKARRYAELGVQHYWLADPERRSLECHRLRDGTFHSVVEGRDDATLVHPDWEGLSIDLGRLWG